ncbi:YbaB/EbfC family nucleoid-associated protein [Campylobacter sp. RM9344]|uniref:Nucleoid-associated protein CCAL12919_07500 n=1 Tax=Campylobacter californiensis TaxID=1032243 RepID=A0AAW3ZXT9_9BACT|nr:MULTISPECIES: YbaB/EbfC family nucleoid-associated protein [unclassified Campylobacter]MBE2985212.1 YbaB/EbfC family nucleoid-associated protein [Campylobacter sp. RM6883]MBE2986962.1 YbaB/EbfC family nucleoid-associated protein [Campylobacter sp. RM12919]MBE2988607.1 YbaB/EbfC family nucleoid-associated protein [Campylobacter sp. RM12920]MBE2995289.1 YbaB/EbfC family nucleoid-associated protein [Campylobacter sp. RM6913]MBE3029931.1 YbaB/EbfC family nucleoid-associated protein [Campylobact
MFEGLDFSKMGAMLEEVQKKAKEFEDESSAREFGAKSGGGLVSVKANGKGEILDISIDDSLLEDKESLQILLISAINDVIKMTEDDKKAMAGRMLGGLGGLKL